MAINYVLPFMCEFRSHDFETVTLRKKYFTVEGQ